MKLNLEGEKCPICHSYLFEEDDVVYCPECGAPHHRDCYLTVGHCGMQELHGTPQQYDIVKKERDKQNKTEPQTNKENTAPITISCNRCGEVFPLSVGHCPKCGAPNIATRGGTFYYDYLGGIPADMDLGEGVTADEAKNFVMANTSRYIPKFAAMRVGKRASWNWLAFLFPCGWFLSRKMKLYGILTGILSVAATLLLLPLNNAMYNLGISENAISYMQMSNLLLENADKVGIAAFVLAAISMLLNLVICLVSGIFGDYLYRNHAITSIKEIKEKSEDIQDDYRRFGGVSIFAMLLGLLAVQYLPAIIATLL